ncbi:hypothetical protein IQ272_13450 [Chroococcidiopsidales cyanobacterium LEGE 13417]|nr:hypothetical protein [Chroococcidiopsidales cyanobacterium LEGE 13417]
MPRKKNIPKQTINGRDFNSTPIPKDLVSQDNNLTPDANGFITIRGKKYHPNQLPPHWKQYYNPETVRNLTVDGGVHINSYDAPSLKGQDE